MIPPPASKAADNNGGSELDKEKIAELELLVTELRTHNEYRLGEISKLREEKIAALQQANRLQSDVSSMLFSDERVAKSRLYAVRNGSRLIVDCADPVSSNRRC
jgi:hypothetical protein